MIQQDPSSFGIGRRSDAITVRSLTKKYGKLTALDNVSFSIPRGEAAAVIGQNGAGKTSLVEIIVNLRKATSGSVSIFGHDVPSNPKIVSTIGVQLQEAALFPHVRVGRYMKLYSDLYGVPRDYGDLVERLGLTDHLKKRLSELSGGLKQRALLAFALINDPEILILDEPSTGLDPIAREELWTFVENWQRDGDRTLLLTSHFMDEVERLCSRVIVIAQGQIVADGSVPSLLEGMPDGISTLQGAYSRLVEAV
ncbi:MAG: ABC transporter ATP-binding protein [Pseudomonadota bacterium]